MRAHFRCLAGRFPIPAAFLLYAAGVLLATRGPGWHRFALPGAVTAPPLLASVIDRAITSVDVDAVLLARPGPYRPTDLGR